MGRRKFVFFSVYYGFALQAPRCSVSRFFFARTELRCFVKMIELCYTTTARGSTFECESVLNVFVWHMIAMRTSLVDVM